MYLEAVLAVVQGLPGAGEPEVVFSPEAPEGEGRLGGGGWRQAEVGPPLVVIQPQVGRAGQVRNLAQHCSTYSQQIPLQYHVVPDEGGGLVVVEELPHQHSLHRRVTKRQPVEVLLQNA